MPGTAIQTYLAYGPLITKVSTPSVLLNALAQPYGTDRSGK